MDHGAGTSNSTPSNPSSPASSTSSPASLLERRNRRRSSALSGTQPAEAPLADSDQRLAIVIGRINSQDSKEAAPQVPQLPLPVLIVPPLNITSSATAADSRQSTQKTSTQASFRILSTQRTARAVVRSHVRNGSRATTTFHLFPIKDQSESKTPTRQEPDTSPVRAKPNFSPPPSSGGDEQSLSSSRTPLSGDYELSPSRSPREVQLSPYRSFTRRMYTNSPLDSPSSQAEGDNIEQHSPQKVVNSRDGAKSSDTRDVSNPHSPREPFPSFEGN
jgi:hypothetical protein